LASARERAEAGDRDAVFEAAVWAAVELTLRELADHVDCEEAA